MKKSNESRPRKHEAPALTLETRENQLVALAMNLAEQRLRDGKATSQEIVYFLKAGSPDEKLKRQLLEAQAELAKAKAEAIENEKQNAKLFEEAIAAFKEYNGESYEDTEPDQDVFAAYDV